MPALDATHDARRRSWVASANGHSEFPIQNLPFAVFAPVDAAPRGGVAIGDEILDLAALASAGLIRGPAETALAEAAKAPLNDFLAMGREARVALRAALSELLDAAGDGEARARSMLHRAADCALHLPARIGDYTDFYAGIHHALTVGAMFRPDNPLLPNYKHIPIGYHGRSSSIRPSGEAVRRPNGQRKPPTEDRPSFGPCRNLDIELELGVWVGPGNPLGQPIPMSEAADHIAGFCLLNDWSARDIQTWEYQPLGPFLAKSFASTISPWIVTPEALAPFRAPQPKRPEGDPQPLPYLLDETDQREGALDLEIEAYLVTPGMRRNGSESFQMTRGTALNLYWTVSQFVAHHTCGGCNLNPGDLLGSGTISGPERAAFGSLLEISRGGADPLQLPTGESRTFLQDGDEVILRAHARRDGHVSIGFGECRAVILPAI